MASERAANILGIGNDSFTNDGLFNDGLSCRIRPVIPPVCGLPEADVRSIEGNAYFFVLADEVLPSGKLIRKVISIPNAAQQIVAYPELYGLTPRDLESTLSIGEHALGNNNSRYTSASTKPKGAPNFTGRPVYIDINKVKASGGKIHSSQEIIDDLDRLVQENPQLKARVDKLKSAILHVEGEVLLEGRVSSSAIKSHGAMQTTHVLRVFQVVGFVLTAYDFGNATVKSFKQNSVKPLVAEGIRQVGGWGAAIAGMKFGGAAGIAIGIETGPGAIISGATGAIVFGFAGYFGADWIADHIDEN